MLAKSLIYQDQQPHRVAGMFPLIPPLLSAIIAGSLASYFELYPTLGTSDAGSFGGTLASVGSTMLGFMLASLAVLASINHTHLVTMMKKNGHYDDLLITVFVGSGIFLLCAIEGFAIVFGATPKPALLCVVIGTHIGAAISLLDVGRKFWLVLSSLR